MTSESLAPIRRTIDVSWPCERAFHRFTTEIGAWWPLLSHSVGQADALSVEFEPRLGGRIVERVRGGAEHIWGTVLAWEPPARVRFTWHPGREPRTAQEIEVRFSPHGTGSRVELVHSGWETLGDDAGQARRGYPLGWAYVLSLYANRRGMLVRSLEFAGRLLVLVGRLRRRRGHA